MSYKAIDVFGPNRLGRIRLEAPESRPSLLKICVLPEQYYPIKESYNDASETRELCPPIQITGACSLTNGKCSRIPVQSCPKLVGEPRGGDPPPYLPLSWPSWGGGRQVDLGGGGARGAELVIQRSSQKADAEFLPSPWSLVKLALQEA